MGYFEVCKRRNNTKRKYVVVNKNQCKHYPSSPSNALHMFYDLVVQLDIKDITRTLVVGFAETATAIGTTVAVSIGCDFINTTRECFDSKFIEFSETHSHATEQKLAVFDFSKYKHIIFVEDEITTGNTILGIVDKLLECNPGFRFSVVSVLNGMHKKHKATYKQRGISVFFLDYIDNTDFSSIASAIIPNKKRKHISGKSVFTDSSNRYRFELPNTRRVTDPLEYISFLDKMWKCLSSTLDNTQNILVLGTEECMFPAVYLGYLMEKSGKKVYCHATTRSPIETSDKKGYPLHSCFDLPSVYDSTRKTFIYNLHKYDKVYIVSDGVDDTGFNALIKALELKGNKDITLVQLKEIS